MVQFGGTSYTWLNARLARAAVGLRLRGASSVQLWQDGQQHPVGIVQRFRLGDLHGG